MRTFIFEARNRTGTAGGPNWGKFLVGLFDSERRHVSLVAEQLLLRSQGWTPEHLLVLDLATGEGAVFRPGGWARADLHKHRIHVCVLFEAFLHWLYAQDLTQLEELAKEVVWLPDVEPAVYGYRRPGHDLDRDG